MIQDGEAPTHKSYKHCKWIEQRVRLTMSINKELGRRKRAERLIAIGHGEGLYLVNEEDIAELVLDKRVRKIVSSMQAASKEMRAVAICDKIPTEDKMALLDSGRMVEITQNGYLATMVRQRSLPKPIKQRILKHLGIKTPAKKKKKKVVSMRNKPTRKWSAEAKKPFDKPTKLFPAGQILKTSAEAALYARVSKRTIRRWVQENDMPVTKEDYYIKSALDGTKNL